MGWEERGGRCLGKVNKMGGVLLEVAEVRGAYLFSKEMRRRVRGFVLSANGLCDGYLLAFSVGWGCFLRWIFFAMRFFSRSWLFFA